MSANPVDRMEDGADARFEALLNPRHGLGELQVRSVRGGGLTSVAQLVRLLVSFGSTVVLARLLAPEEYGLVSMVLVLLAFLEMFKDAGLSSATVQRERISQAQVSTLFWLNAGLGLALALIVAAAAPVVAAFYREPRLVPVTLALSATFLLSGLAIQHQAILRRLMRFRVLVVIELAALLGGLAVGIGLAWRGYGYWAIVAMNLATVVVTTFGSWLSLSWRPGRPGALADVRDMVRFGGHIMGNNFLNAFVRNAPQILMGWTGGAGPLGLYNRAYQLLMLPLTQVNAPVGQVVAPALSRLQSDHEGLRRYYLGAYRLVVSVTVPVMAASAIYAEELVRIILGPVWAEAGPIFRWLAVAGLFIAVMSPTGWFLVATGRTSRYFRLGFVETPIVLAGCALGVSHGALGLAMGFAAARAVECLPMMYLIFRGTEIAPGEIWRVVRGPYAAAAGAAVAGELFRQAAMPWLGPVWRGVAGCGLTLGVYAVILLVVLRQWSALRDMVGLLRNRRG